MILYERCCLYCANVAPYVVVIPFECVYCSCREFVVVYKAYKSMVIAYGHCNTNDFVAHCIFTVCCCHQLTTIVVVVVTNVLFIVGGYVAAVIVALYLVFVFVLL